MTKQKTSTNIIKNSFFTLMVRGLPGGVKSLIYIFIARNYNPELLGKFALVMASLEIFRVFADIGIGTASLRRFAQREKIFRTSLTVNIFSSALTYLIAIAFAIFQYRDTFFILMIAIGGFSFFSSSISNTIYAYYHSRLSISKISGLTLYGAVFSLFFAGGAIYFKLNLYIIMISLTTADLITLVLLVMRTSRYEELSSTFDFSILKGLLKDSVPLFFTGIFAVFYTRANIFFISYFNNKTEVGYYAAIESILGPILLVISSLAPTFYGLFSGLQKGDALKPAFIRYLFTILVLGITSATFLTFWAEPVVHMLLPAYPKASTPFILMAWVVFLKLLTIYCAQLISSFGQFKVILLVSFVACITNISMNILLTPLWGAKGAILSTGFSEFVQLLIMGQVCYRLLKKTCSEKKTRQESLSEYYK